MLSVGYCSLPLNLPLFPTRQFDVKACVDLSKYFPTAGNLLKNKSWAPRATLIQEPDDSGDADQRRRLAFNLGPMLSKRNLRRFAAAVSPNPLQHAASFARNLRAAPAVQDLLHLAVKAPLFSASDPAEAPTLHASLTQTVASFLPAEGDHGAQSVHLKSARDLELLAMLCEGQAAWAAQAMLRLQVIEQCTAGSSETAPSDDVLRRSQVRYRSRRGLMYVASLMFTVSFLAFPY